MTRAPLIDGFQDLTAEEKDKVYRRALERCGVEGVRKLEHDIRVKIEQRTSGGPFALRKAFKYFDRDGSGDIDPDEFYAAMDWFGLQFTEDGVLALFGLYDEDRGGSLGYYEFVENLIDGFSKGSASGSVKETLSAAMFATREPPSPVKNTRHVNIDQAKLAFDFCDTNGSGRIELSELDGVLRTLGMSTDSDLVNAAMLVLDKDGSGDVTFEEFWEWWQYAVGTGQAKKSYGSIGDKGGRNSKSDNDKDYSRADLENMSRTGSGSPVDRSGARSPWGAPQSPYGGNNKAAPSPVPHGQGGPAVQGDVLGGPASGVPKWMPPKAGSAIRKP
jgi:Ca2+-binding EF-hand superfamily protein